MAPPMPPRMPYRIGKIIIALEAKSESERPRARYPAACQTSQGSRQHGKQCKANPDNQAQKRVNDAPDLERRSRLNSLYSCHLCLLWQIAGMLTERVAGPKP